MIVFESAGLSDRVQVADIVCTYEYAEWQMIVYAFTLIARVAHNGAGMKYVDHLIVESLVQKSLESVHVGHLDEPFF